MCNFITAFAPRAGTAILCATCIAALLAGGSPACASDPIVTQDGGTLSVTGDAYANSVSIIGSETTEGTVGVFVSDVPWVYDDVENIVVDLKGGDDYVAMDRIDIPGAVWVLAGHGDNIVRIGGLGYGRNVILDGLAIFGGNGRDEITVRDCTLSGDVWLYAFEGNDEVQWGAPVESDSFTGLDVSLLGQLYVSCGMGHDRFEMWNAADAGLTIDMGAGNDQIGLGAGFSSWAIYGNSIGHPSIVTGGGADEVVIADSLVIGDATIETGGEADFLLLGAFGGAPNQFILGTLDAHGGKGQDTLLVDPANHFDHNPKFKSFELP